MYLQYSNFVHEVAERVERDESGKSLEQILADQTRKFKDSSNYLRYTNRKTGQIKRLKNLLPGQEKFETPVDCDTKYEATDVRFRILRAVYDLLKESEVDALPVYPLAVEDKGPTEAVIDLTADSGDEEEKDEDVVDRHDDSMLEETNKHGFTEKQIRLKYNDTYQDNGHTIESKLLSKTLNLLKSEAHLEKTDSGKWRAKNVKVLELTLKNSEEKPWHVKKISPTTTVQTCRFLPHL